jgi:hypothetical protein
MLVAQALEDPLSHWRCFTGALWSASRIASITGNSGHNFGPSTGFVRV